MFKLVPYKKLNGTMMKKEYIFDQFFDNFFNDVFEPISKMENRFNSFKVDVIDKDGYYLIEADLPGFDKENVTVEYDNNYLTITAKKDEESKIEEENFIRRERRSGEFRRSFFVEDVEVETIDAAFNNGVLRIELKKSEPSQTKKTIEIK